MEIIKLNPRIKIQQNRNYQEENNFKTLAIPRITFKSGKVNQEMPIAFTKHFGNSNYKFGFVLLLYGYPNFTPLPEVSVLRRVMCNNIGNLISDSKTLSFNLIQEICVSTTTTTTIILFCFIHKISLYINLTKQKNYDGEYYFTGKTSTRCSI